jgi:hypothetical protein
MCRRILAGAPCGRGRLVLPNDCRDASYIYMLRRPDLFDGPVLCRIDASVAGTTQLTSVRFRSRLRLPTPI